ncbi:hypothetical protein ACWGE1_18845 [Streptomyces sp. NPDC054932]
MLHEIEDLEIEANRVSRRPERDSAPPVLVEVDLAVDGDPVQYADRLRGVLGAVLRIAASEPVCRGGTTTEPFATEGRDRYRARTGGEPWELQNWLSRFDPELEVRGWAWWDLTRPPAGEGRLRLWADTWGEPSFAWEDLRWLLYTCGARTVADPVIVQPETWAGEVSV